MTRIALLVTIASLVFTASANANYTGKIQLFCSPNLSEVAAVDPILAPGVDPFWESQTPAGSESFSDSTTLTSMEAAPTSCSVQNDDSLFWVPTPYTSAGVPATIKTMSYYIIEQAGSPVTSTPVNGTDVLGGSPQCDSTSCESGHFNCVTPSGGLWTGQQVPPVSACKTGVGYQEMVASTNTVPIIEVVMEVNSDGVGGYLSEDINPTARPGESASFDFIYGWLNNALSNVVADCMRIPTVPQNELTCREHLDSDGITRLYYNNPVTNKADLTKLVTS